MNKQLLDHIWDHTRQTYGVYLRILEAIPEDKLHTHPIPGMRSPAQLAAHVSGSIVRDIARGVASGEIVNGEAEEEVVAAKLKTRKDLLAYAEECWSQANAAVESIQDEQLNATVQTPWNMTFQGRVGIHILNEEFLHHRGQLSAFVRASGGAPPMIWGFQDNAPAYQPRS